MGMSIESSEPGNDPSSDNPENETGQPAPGRKKGLVKGVAFGIGSAAIVAALLFAGRNKNKPEG
jgi:hypothetical protein